MSITYTGAVDNQELTVSVGELHLISYEQFVTNLVKALGTDEQDMIHMMMGITGEAGELMDAIKKHTIYGKPLDLENVIEELGDLEFYITGLRQILKISRNETIKHNVAKLRQRYKSGSYSDAAAIAREDKQLVSEGGQPLESSKLHVIDMSKQPATTPELTDEQVHAVDETAQLGVTGAYWNPMTRQYQATQPESIQGYDGSTER